MIRAQIGTLRKRSQICPYRSSISVMQKMYGMAIFWFTQTRDMSLLSGLNFSYIWLNVMQIELNFKSTHQGSFYLVQVSIPQFGCSSNLYNTQTDTSFTHTNMHIHTRTHSRTYLHTETKILFLFCNANRSFCVLFSLELYDTHVLIRTSCAIHRNMKTQFVSNSK